MSGDGRSDTQPEYHGPHLTILGSRGVKTTHRLIGKKGRVCHTRREKGHNQAGQLTS